MSRPRTDKNYSNAGFWIIAVVSFAIGSAYACAGAESPPHYQMQTDVTHQRPEVASIINSACDKIFRGDFESARGILDKTVVSDSDDIIELRKIIDEYRAIKERRRVLQDKTYRTRINALEELRQIPFSDDVNSIGKVFSLVLSISEYADEEQKQALLQEPLLAQTIQKAKARAAEFEAEGKWLDSYRICYNKLRQIYKDDESYSVYADRLLDKADILTTLGDNPCGTCEERHTDIEKQMFVKAVDFLDHSYVKIVDYRNMAAEAIDRCRLSAEVMSRLDVNNKYKITNAQYVNWSEALGKVENKINQSQADIGKDEFTGIFEQVFALNESPYVGTALPSKLLLAQFAEGAFSALDPYTVIYWPDQSQDLEKPLTNQFSGIGIKFSKQEGQAKVITVFPDTPAYKSGLKTGDIIMEVDGIETKDVPSDCLAEKITGTEGTSVTLKVRRSKGDKTCDISLNRARITVPSVHGWQRDKKGNWLYILDGYNNIGYVRISSFSSGTADDFEKVLCQLEKSGLKGLVLDLRSNPGGLLSSAVEITDKFISEGLLVRIQPRCGMSTYISAHQQGTHADYPVVVIINQFTASAAEILAGALQDSKYKRAILVGQKTYGKGSVQSVTDYCGKGAQLKYTVAFYHLPCGRRVESREVMEKLGRTDWGILPDVNVKLRSDELQKITEAQKATECVVTNGQDDAFISMDRNSSPKRIDDDPQLAVGLLVLKSKMIQAGHKLIEAAQR